MNLVLVVVLHVAVVVVAGLLMDRRDNLVVPFWFAAHVPRNRRTLVLFFRLV